MDKRIKKEALLIANNELVFQNQEKEKRAAELLIANRELSFQNQEKEKRTAQLIKANLELKRAKEYQNEYTNGLEEIMFITSHKVRQPISNILGISYLLNQPSNSPEELKESLFYMKQSALALDTYTKELTVFIFNLKQKGKKINKIEN